MLRLGGAGGVAGRSGSPFVPSEKPTSDDHDSAEDSNW